VILWLDAQISPRLCSWIAQHFAVEAIHVRELHLREGEDAEIFDHARKADVVVFTKDEDFVELVRRLGMPPQVLWLRCGNMSNAHLKTLLHATLPAAIDLLNQGEPIVEIGLVGGESGRRKRRSTRPRPRTGTERAKRRSGRVRRSDG
jgi:predicted nuclease of predicted toxin-antitoxin system